MTISTVTAEAKDRERHTEGKRTFGLCEIQSVGCHLFGGLIPDICITIQNSIKIRVMK